MAENVQFGRAPARSWSFTYDEKTQIMRVTFPNGREYAYDGVPPDLYKMSQEADSKGDFFNTYLRDQY